MKLKFNNNYPLWYNLFWGPIINSKLYWYLYYKHSKKHKNELKKTYDSVRKRRKEIIGK